MNVCASAEVGKAVVCGAKIQNSKGNIYYFVRMKNKKQFLPSVSLSYSILRSGDNEKEEKLKPGQERETCKAFINRNQRP